MNHVRHTIFSLLLIFLTSCQSIQKPSKKPASTSVITLCINSDITALDLRTSFLAPTLHVLRMLFEGLTRLGPDGTPILALADSYEISEDGKMYTFHLRKSQWSNGEPITAHDFYYSWRGTLDSSNPSRSKVAFYPIKNVESFSKSLCAFDEVGIRVLDDMTLQIELEHPYKPLLQLLAYPTFAPLPKKIDEASKDWLKQTGELYICNGPFTLKSHVEGKLIRLVKNPNYWDAGNIQLEGVLIYVIPDIGTQDAMFQIDEIDFIGQPLVDLPTEIISRLETSHDLRQLSSTDIFWCAVNTNHPILSHPKIREALATAINRHELVEYILPKGFQGATSILPLQMTQLTHPRFSDGDAEKAKKLFGEALKEMNLSPADLPAFTLIYSPKDIVDKVIQVVCNQWKKTLGVDIKLECVELKMRQAKMKSGAFELGTYTWFSWIDDPCYTMHNYRTKETLYNYTGWSNPAFTHLLNQFQASSKNFERANLLRQAEELIMQELPLVPIYFGALNFAQNSALRGLVITPYYEFDLRWAYFQN